MALRKITLKNFGLRILRLVFETGTSISSNLAASAIGQGDAMSATALTGFAAACLAARTSADHYAQPPSADELTKALVDLRSQVESLREVVRGLASGDIASPYFPQDTAQSFISLLESDVSGVKTLSEQQNEILFTMVRWLEAWQQEHNEEFSQLRSVILDEGEATRDKLRMVTETQRTIYENNRSAHAETHRRLDRIADRFVSQGKSDAQTSSEACIQVTTKGPSSAIFYDIARLEPVTAAQCIREAKLRVLDRIWQQRKKTVVIIVGTPGAGKSALLHYWLGRLAANGWKGARRVFAWTFSRDGSHDQAAPDMFFEKALRRFGHRGVMPLSTRAKGERLAQLIQREPALLVLDGFELFLQSPGGEDGRIRQPGLATLVRLLIGYNPGLCVITTTQSIADCLPFVRTCVRQIELKGLSPSQGARFLRSLNVLGPERELRLASQELNGNPMALELLAGYLVELLQGDIRRRAEARLLEQDVESGGRATSLMVAYEHHLSGCCELATLKTLSFFDRPPVRAEFDAIINLPPIAGLTDPPNGDVNNMWNRAIARLQRARLVEKHGSGAAEHTKLNAIAREYFRRRVKEHSPIAWQEGNSRLYNHFLQIAPERPQTLAEMLPSVDAVVYGCRAGRAAEVLDRVFIPRIRQLDEHFSTHRLGAWSFDLVALTEFFDVPWSQPCRGLSPRQEAYVLKEAGFSLWALGWLHQAVVSMESSLVINEREEEYEQAARVAGNLSEILVALGELEQAERHARNAVSFADKSGQPQQQITRRASLAHVLHQMGQLPEAFALFSHSECLQSEEQPSSPTLYARSGCQYCDLLLDDAETQLQSEPEKTRAILQDVRSRATETLRLLGEERVRTPTLSDFALDHLTLGRVGFLLCLLDDENDQDMAQAHLDKAIAGIQDAGTNRCLPAALIIRAGVHRIHNRWKDAECDVHQALHVAQAQDMCLQEADALLEYTRICIAQGKRTLGREHLGSATSIIRTKGYHRREMIATSLNEALSHRG